MSRVTLKSPWTHVAIPYIQFPLDKHKWFLFFMFDPDLYKT